MTASPGSINLTQAELLLLAMTRPDRAALIIGPKYVPARALVAAEYMRPACEGEPWPLTAEGIRLALELVRGFSSAEACRELAQFQGSKAQRRRWFQQAHRTGRKLNLKDRTCTNTPRRHRTLVLGPRFRPGGGSNSRRLV